MAPNSPPVVIGYDGSADAELALTWAAESVRARSQPLVVAVVGTLLDPVVGHFREEEDRRIALLRADADQRLRDLKVVGGRVEVRHGAVVPELLRTAQHAEMLVVGSRGHGVAGLLLGSVSQHVARHAPCPVVVVRPHRPTHEHRIIVGVDGSPESESAIRFACERASSTREQVVAVHGYHAYSSWMSLDVLASEALVRRTEAADLLVAEALAGFATEFPDVDLLPQAVPVVASALLVDFSRNATLLVVGSRGRGAFAELLLGSVSQHVLQHAECPVAVVR